MNASGCVKKIETKKQFVQNTQIAVEFFVKQTDTKVLDHSKKDLFFAIPSNNRKRRKENNKSL